MTYQIHVLNGAKKKHGAKKTGAKKKASARKKSGRKKTGAKKRTSSAKRPPMAKKRKSHKKRAHAPRTAALVINPKKKRRHRNPMNKAAIKGGLKDLGGMAVGLLAVNAAIRNIPGLGSPPVGASGPSSFAGERWTLPQYAVAGAIALIGPKLVGKTKIVDGKSFQHGALAAIAMKALFTELLPKIPGANRFLGLGEADGELREDPVTGNTMIFANGAWQALQGLEEKTVLDGYGYSGFSGLEPKTQLDGPNDYGPRRAVGLAQAYA